MTIELVEQPNTTPEPTESKLMKFLGGRKFLLAYSLAASATALCAFGRIDGITYSGIVLAIMSVYCGANVIQKKYLVESTATTPVS